MSKIVIKKRVSLDFLGDEYKESYLVFRSIPLKDYSSIIDEMPKQDPRYVELLAKLEDLSEAEKEEFENLQSKQIESNKKNFTMILDYLKKYFYSGEFPDDNGKLCSLDSPDDLDGLDQESAVKCFEMLTGQKDDPKEQNLSTTASSTV